MNAGTEAGEGVGKEDIATEVSMAGLHCVTGGEVNWSTGQLVIWKGRCPAFDGDFDGSLVLFLRNDSLTAFDHRFYMYVLGTIPILYRTDTYGTGDAEDIVTVTEGEQGVVGIPMTLGKFELRGSFAIDVDGLFLIEIDTIGHEFGLYGDTMVMKRMVGVVLAYIIRHRIGPFGDGVAMTNFSAFGEDGIAFSKRIGWSTDSPERSRYARGTGP